MSKRIGSIYSVEVDGDRVHYFWDVGTDHSQLGSALIVVFRRSYPKSATPDFDEIVTDDVDFYCHATVLVGKTMGRWSKAGFRPVTKTFPMLFRDSNDYGNPAVRVSERWYVWEPNQPFRDVGRLTGDLTKAEIGVVLSPDSIVSRIRTGVYDMFYPAYDRGHEPYV
jgi:hypothetical protein